MTPRGLAVPKPGGRQWDKLLHGLLRDVRAGKVTRSEAGIPYVRPRGGHNKRVDALMRDAVARGLVQLRERSHDATEALYYRLTDTGRSELEAWEAKS